MQRMPVPFGNRLQKRYTDEADREQDEACAFQHTADGSLHQVDRLVELHTEKNFGLPEVQPLTGKSQVSGSSLSVAMLRDPR